ncbi:uncharacterized protein LOC101237919 isoform X1 [Hydra vulgaris]|uniref:uncharacterized protein LOC101237919 isoform X1 n=2 Tax=Hydra vulgaris TaxID=6087 RepID=UPI001F5F8903|nr:uncharacterized protein LOC101237919 isoform X1 [Hydra vulgaris]
MAGNLKVISSNEETASDNENNDYVLKDIEPPESPVFQPRKKFLYSPEVKDAENTQVNNSQLLFNNRTQSLTAYEQIIIIKGKQEHLLKSIESGCDFFSICKLHDEIKLMLGNVHKILSIKKNKLNELHHSQMETDSQLPCSQTSSTCNQSSIMSAAQRILVHQKMLIKLFNIQKLISLKMDSKKRLTDNKHCVLANNSAINEVSDELVLSESQKTQNLIRNLVATSYNEKDQHVDDKVDVLPFSNSQSCNIFVQMLHKGVMNAGDDVLSINYKGKKVYAGLRKDGSIYSKGKDFQSVEDWIFFIRGAKVSKQTLMKMVRYIGKPLSSLMLSNNKKLLKSDAGTSYCTGQEISNSDNSVFLKKVPIQSIIPEESNFSLQSQFSLNVNVQKNTETVQSISDDIQMNDIKTNQSNVCSTEIDALETKQSSIRTTQLTDCIQATKPNKEATSKNKKRFFDMEVKKDFIESICNIRLFDKDEFVKSSDILPDGFWDSTFFKIDEEFIRRVGF